MLTPLALLLATGGPAWAEQAGVYVAPFQVESAAGARVADQVPTLLLEALDAHPELRPIRVDEVGAVHDMDARTYATSCPPRQGVGCAFVVGETAGAALAVAGSVMADGDGIRVDVHVIDVAASVDVIAFQATLGEAGPAPLASGIASLVGAVARGEVKAEADIRQRTVADDRTAEHAAVAGQLGQLDQEMGGVSSIVPREGIEIETPNMTMEQLLDRMEVEGSKPWERMDMSPRGYLRYKNSGHSLREWNQRRDGRRSQLVLRAHLGFGTAPTHGSYYGRYARSAEDLNIAETWAWQSAESGSTFGSGASAGWGILPELELGLVGGYGSGRFSVNIHGSTVGQNSSAPPAQDFSNGSWYVGPQVLAGLLPTFVVRPVVGGNVLFIQGQSVEQHILPPEDLPLFPAPSIVQVNAILGAEARLSRRIDFFVHMPLGAVIANSADDAQEHQGEGGLESTKNKSQLSPVGAGVWLGVQVRLFGPKERARTLEDYEYGGDPD